MVKAAQAFPKVYNYEKDGWKITVKFHGVYDQFMLGVAQMGDVKGEVLLTGQGMEFSTEAMNISHVDRVATQLDCKMKNKHNLSLPISFLHDLCEEALRPYH